MNRNNIRALSKVHHADVNKADSEGVTITFFGTNSRGTHSRFKVRLGWWFWPYLVREMAKAWLPVRNSKLTEINSLDKTLKQEAGA